MYQTSTSKGQELVAQRMVRDFISIGHKAYLITSVYHDGVEAISPESLTEGKGYVEVKDPVLGIPVIRVASYITKWPRRRISFRDFVHVLERIVDEFKLNVLITHSTLWNGPEEVAKFVEWRRYMKDLGGYVDPIVFCHMSHFQDPSPKHYSLVERTFRMAWNRLSLSQILKTANLVLSVTPIEKETNIKMGADPKKCFLFSSGVDEEPFLKFAAADTKDFLKRHNMKKDTKLVSYLGSLEERKNPLGILKVAESLKNRPDIKFAIAGRGETRYADALKEKAKQLPNVTYLGELDEKDKILLIKSSFINILLSKVEALGLTQLEFMYMGVPIVTSGVGGQSWLVRNRREGIHAKGPEDVEGAAKAIQTLADDSEAWNKLSANAKEKARKMTSSKIIRELDDALSEQIAKESGLIQIPQEALLTLAEPEHVAKTWSKGSWGVVATDKRLFIKHGRISRKVTEIPYDNITNIEYTRRYPWKVLVAGLVPMFIIGLEPLWRSILRPEFISAIESAATSIVRTVPQLGSTQMLTVLVITIPFFIGMASFTLQARTGFSLFGHGAKSVYLPNGFREVITYVRNVQHIQPVALHVEQDQIESKDVEAQMSSG